MKKYIIIKADTNDADYVSSKNLITDEQIELIKPVIEAIKNFDAYHHKGRGQYNWICGDIKGKEDLSPQELYVKTGIVSEEAYKAFENLVPYGEYGIHTIESVEILTVTEETKLL